MVAPSQGRIKLRRCDPAFLLQQLLLLLSILTCPATPAEELAGSCSAESKPPNLSQQGLAPLSWVAPRVFWIPHFLSSEECAYMIDYATGHPKFNPEQDLSVAYFGWKDAQTNKVLAAIEDRIGIITGIPPHSHEEPINVHYNRRREPQPGAPAVDNVHHDKVQKEHSAATVIVYLNNVTHGGGTIWPCASVLRNGTTPRYPCLEAFDAGARWFDGTDTTVKGQMRKATQPTAVHSQLLEVRAAASLGCAAESFDNWKRPPIRTQAIEGAAAVFFHNHPNGAADPFSWHGGCLPLSGTKWTLQKFKEMPKMFRDKEGK